MFKWYLELEHLFEARLAVKFASHGSERAETEDLGASVTVPTKS